jgi:multidrug efflux pump subunit AcrA (membrane-fusion protein)
MKKILSRFCMTLIILSFLSLSACHHSSNAPLQNDANSTVITVEKKPQTMDLYYKGIIDPITVFSIMSPVSGRIATLGFTYGDPIAKNQLIATISAADLADNYQKQLSDYISKKDAMEMSQNDYTSTLALFKAGVKTQNDVTTARSTYNNSILALNTSKHTLMKTTALLGIDSKSVESLSLTDVTRVTAELNKQFKNIPVYSDYNGVALHPLDSSINSNNTTNSNTNNTDSTIKVGSDIKQNQLLLSVGDLNGFSTQFNVSEMDIHHFFIGQKVLITGPAFPGITLQGRINQVASQANVSDFGLQSSTQFAISATIPNVSAAIASQIDIGMSAKIDIPLTTPPVITVPIDAISIENGQTIVHKLDQNNQVISQQVTVGMTMIASATIASGLKAGDRIVVPNH